MTLPLSCPERDKQKRPPPESQAIGNTRSGIRPENVRQFHSISLDSTVHPIPKNTWMSVGLPGNPSTSTTSGVG